MGCCWGAWGVKVRVWCYESATATMQCPDGVLFAIAWRTCGSLVLGECHHEVEVPRRGAAGACTAQRPVRLWCDETAIVMMWCPNGVLLAPAQGGGEEKKF